MKRVALIVALLLHALVVGAPAYAHPLSPALLELEQTGEGRYSVLWRHSIFVIPGTSEKRPVLPAHCEVVDAATLEEGDSSMTARWTVDCGAQGIIGSEVGVEGLADTASDALVRIVHGDGATVRSVLTPDEPRYVVPERETVLDVLRGYAWLGFEHILGGPDHLLFVFGLLLLIGSARALVATVTAFTVGHSITLSAAVLGLARLPSGPVEVLIALSVLVLAVELATERGRERSLLRRRPWAMALVFGLLHGFGFAGALREVGLPETEVPAALFSFNVGIEAGQLAFVVAILILTRLGRPAIDRLPPIARRLPVEAMGTLAAFWTFQRLADFLA